MCCAESQFASRDKRGRRGGCLMGMSLFSLFALPGTSPIGTLSCPQSCSLLVSLGNSLFLDQNPFTCDLCVIFVPPNYVYWSDYTLKSEGVDAHIYYI
jgi:hypothetical protein